MILKSILLAILLFPAAKAQSLDLQNDSALRIASVTISEVHSINPALELPKAGSPVGEVITTVDDIIALGQRIWKIVDAGRPVINTKMSSMISILPHLEGENPSQYQMSNWSAPAAKSYRVSYKNGFNSEVVAFTFTIYFQYNGQYQGAGQYITNLKVQATEVYTAWGFDFDATSELVGIANVGSMENPIASATMQISYIVKGKINESRSVQSLYVDGAGNIKLLR